MGRMPGCKAELRRFAWCVVAVSLAAGFSAPAAADDIPTGRSGMPAWAERASEQALRLGPPAAPSIEPAPALIPRFDVFRDASGHLGTFQPGGPTRTDGHGFFTPLGSNGRTCQTCHQPAAAWTITPPQIKAAFRATGGTAPLFRPVDGAVCPNADFSTVESRRSAYRLVLDKGLIRIFIPLPAPPTLQFSVVGLQDANGCNADPQYGLTSFGPTAPTQGTVSVYRRPLPTTNMPFLTAFMWDGREPTLQSQATDAVRIHFQGAVAPTTDQLAQITAFEQGLYSAQIAGHAVGRLDRDSALGGPVNLSRQPFHPGINDVLGGDPSGAPFDNVAMTDFSAWQDELDGEADSDDRKAQVARGEQLFNTKPIAITGVAGLNDKLGQPTIHGFCTTCHDTPNVGNHSLKLPIDIGVVAPQAAGLDTTGLPVFTLRCDAGALAGQVFRVTDPGKALVSGQCADIGKMKGPILRGLAARAPYFHNGSAPDLAHVVDFYNTRFAIGFTEADKAALVAFLNKL